MSAETTTATTETAATTTPTQAAEATAAQTTTATETATTTQTAAKTETRAPKVVTKELFDKTASELAEAKRKLAARMTADELAEAKAEEARMELETLRKERQLAKLEVSLAKSGVENCAEIAELFAGGETEKAIAALSTAKDAQIKALQDEITTLKLRGAEKPPTGEGNDKFAGKSLAELMQIANADPAMEKQIMQYLDSKNKKE